MKKLIVMAIAILITASIAAFASGNPPGAVQKKQINYQVSFSRIEVLDDIDVELKESNSKTIDVTGSEAAIENVDWKIKGGILYLRSKKGSLKDRVKVTIDVTRLKEILIEGKSTVSSAGTLFSPALSIYINHDCYVSIKNSGPISVVYGVDTEVDIKKVVGDVTVNRS